MATRAAPQDGDELVADSALVVPRFGDPEPLGQESGELSITRSGDGCAIATSQSQAKRSAGQRLRAEGSATAGACERVVAVAFAALREWLLSAIPGGRAGIGPTSSGPDQDACRTPSRLAHRGPGRDATPAARRSDLAALRRADRN